MNAFSLQSRPWRRATLLAAAMLVCASGARAEAIVGADADIGANAANGTLGAVTVNEAAGLDNAQSNQLTITSGVSGMGAALNGTSSEQSASVKARVANASASIGQGAFANASGAVLVNQTAGVGNTQSNSAQIGTGFIGVQTVSDIDLSRAAAANGGRGQSGGSGGIREASISSTAFRNATGLVQLNQTAGAGNATANSFVLRPPAGTLFN